MDKNRISIRDQRCCQPIGLKNPKGDIVVYSLGETVAIKGRLISITKPNVISLFISKSLKEFSEAESIKIQIDHGVINKQNEIVTGLVYDYFEAIMSSVINIFCAVETFVNQCIPNDFIYRRKNSKRIIEEYNKELIERWCTLDEKLNSVMPEIFGIDKLHNKDFWGKFKLLEKLRNEIIHPKTYKEPIRLEVDNGYIKVNNEFLNMLCDDNVKELIQSGIDLIMYIVKNTPDNVDYPIFENFFEVVIKQVNDFGDELMLIQKNNAI